jgi:hypothetical protein
VRGGGVSANVYSFAHGAQINFGYLTLYLTYALPGATVRDWPGRRCCREASSSAHPPPSCTYAAGSPRSNSTQISPGPAPMQVLFNGLLSCLSYLLSVLYLHLQFLKSFIHINSSGTDPWVPYHIRYHIPIQHIYCWHCVYPLNQMHANLKY